MPPPTKIPTSALRYPPTIPYKAILTLKPSARSYATSNPTPNPNANPSPPSSTRKAITPFTDDGRIQWRDLSFPEKAARTTQQSFNFLLVAAGVLGTGVVAFALFTDLFSFDSKYALYNRAADRILADKDGRVQELLGENVNTYGEGSWSRWARNRALASRSEKDRAGTEHAYLEFNVQGSKAVGRAHLHMSKRSGEGSYEYRYLYIDVQGKQRLYLEQNDHASINKASGKIFGVKFW